MTVWLLWNEDAQLVRVFASYAGALTYLRTHHETNQLRTAPLRGGDGDDIEIEVEIEGARYRLEPTAVQA